MLQILRHSYVLRKFGRLTTQKSPKFGTYNSESLILKWCISLSSQRISAIFIKNLRLRLHEYVFIENATIVLHLHIVFRSLSYWRPFSKVIVFSRLRIVLFGDRFQKLLFSVVFVLFSLKTVFKSYCFQSFSYCSLLRCNGKTE